MNSGINDSDPIGLLRLLYGGTFDPPHNAHLALARTAARLFEVPVHLLPNGSPRHRGGPQASAQDRLNMLRLAVADDLTLRVDDREIPRSGRPALSGYSVDTLRQIRAELGSEQPIAWLIGADAFAGLDRWHDWLALGDLCHFVVAARPDLPSPPHSSELERWAASRWRDEPAALSAQPSGLLFRLPFKVRPESASDIRERLGRGEPCDALLSPAVARYIDEQGLYRHSPA